MKRILAFVLAAVMSVFMLAGCGASYETLEEYLNSDKEYLEDITGTAEEENVDVECRDNTLIMTYDMGKMSDTEKSNYTNVFESMSEDINKEMGPLVAELEEESGLEGVVFKVIYKSGDDVVYEKEFVNEEKDDK